MLKFWFTFPFLLFIVTGFSQDKVIYDENAKLRPVSSFHSIELTGSVDLIITNGEDKLAVSESERENGAIVLTTIEKDVLKISVKGKEQWWKTGTIHNPKLKVYVSINNLKSLISTGSGNIQFIKFKQSTDVNFRLIGSGNIIGEVEAGGIKVLQAGSGNLRLKGSAEKLNVNLAGSGNISFVESSISDAVIVINGSGNVDVMVNKTLDAKINGSGNIHYKGEGQLISSQIRGSGKIRKI